jgi:SAM-dependent methyltransferase
VTDPAPGPDPSSDWYRSAFGPDYLRVYRARSAADAEGEARFAARALGLAAGDRVLDVACGAGRHSGALRAAGLRAVGFDLSAPLLAAARARLGPGLPLVRGDMRALPFGAAFRAALSFFTSFGYFPAEADDRRTLAELARVVVPAGGLLLDLPDREATIARLVPRSEREEEGVRIEELRRLSPDRRRVLKEVRIRRSGGSEAWRESVRLYDSSEVERMLAGAGWRPTARHGDFSGAPWRSGEGPRMIIVARRERGP